MLQIWCSHLKDKVFFSQTKIGKSRVSWEVIVGVRVRGKITASNRDTPNSILDAESAKIRAVLSIKLSTSFQQYCFKIT